MESFRVNFLLCTFHGTGSVGLGGRRSCKHWTEVEGLPRRVIEEVVNDTGRTVPSRTVQIISFVGIL